MRTKNIIIIIGIILVLIATGIITFFFVFGQQSILIDPRIGLQTQTATWQNIPIELESTYFGTRTNGPTPENAFCGNDGDITISNSFNVNDKFSLSSSIQGSDRSCSGNGINAKLTILGKLKGTFSLSSFDSKDQETTSSFTIQKGTSNLLSRAVCHRRDTTSRCGGIFANDAGDFELNFDEPTEIEIRLESNVGGSGNSNVNLDLNLELIEEECQINEEKCEGFIWFTCTPDNTFGEQGITRTKCGVDCKIDGDCEDGFECNTSTYKCEEKPAKSINILPYIAGAIIVAFIIIIIVIVIRRRRKK